MNQRNPSPQKRTCHDLGVCQQRTPPCRGCEPFNALIDAPIKLPAPKTPAKPRTVWAFAISFDSWDLVAAVALVALAYFSAGYNG